MFGNLTVGSDRQSVSVRVAAALLLFIAGSFLVYAVGFANSHVLHNAAHDVRHAVFPCH